MATALDILTILSVGFMIGTEFAVSAFVNPILARLDAKAETAATRLFAQKLGQVMPFWYVLCFVLMTLEAWMRRHNPEVIWLVVAGSLFAFAIVMTLIFLVPINNRISEAQEEVFPDSLRQEHRIWDRLHRGRVLVLVSAMVLFLVGIHA
ncbi:MAG TPA: DUF1772 domain-containing protein [Terracidiphilus sp.]|jgi:uncharacterized membrane protein|nr:DUF1772 domain-containing protein [Terracidiphilus sp.]